MKKLFHLIFFFHLFSTSSLSSMEPEKPVRKKIYSMACLPNNTIALASEQGCDLITNPLSPTDRIVKNVRKQPTFRLISNKNKDKICLCGAKECKIYGINIKTKLGSHCIASYSMMNCEAFSVVFNPIDDSLISRQDDELFIDKTKRYVLPYVGDNRFPLDCHPNGKEILYPRSNSTLTVRNIHGGPGYDYSPDWRVQRCFYSPNNGHHIAIITEVGNLFIYKPKYNKSILFKSARQIHDATFLPDHKSVALIDEFNYIHFWEFTTGKRSHISTFGDQEISSRKKIVISPNESEFAVLIENQCFMGNIPAYFTKNKMLFVCWILQQYSQKNNDFLLPEIIGLFIKSMGALQEKPMLTLIAL